MDTKEYWSTKHRELGRVEKPLPLNPFAEQCLYLAGLEERLLNLGAGQGEDSIFFAQQGFSVVTTDISPVAIDLSRKRAMLAGENTVEHLIVDVRNTLPFDDGSFDIVFSNLGLHIFLRR